MSKAKRLLRQIPKVFPQLSDNFKIQLPDEPNSDSGGFFDDTPDNQTSPTLIDVYDPILPADGNTLNLLLNPGGNVVTYAYQWFSKKEYPMKTLVFYHGMSLVVNRIDPYVIAGFSIYYLNDRSDDKHGVSSKNI
ncbi:hypothetical protein IWT140_01709 [Secundilactobacillus pentosiphilus]|uniref:Uncharacterized protein n=1 Tax=Secundilactobacillus pentosiphilus TaxID=1714682 RepID=A0A1Z5IR55_9LACO|nr:hypothetical protein [Secundilactobacillus pentosiphilus]GAX04072.1 hypothetical protein IWT140_01709 [Secundilactobacillus pentosiphilus]